MHHLYKQNKRAYKLNKLAYNQSMNVYKLKQQQYAIANRNSPRFSKGGLRADFMKESISIQPTCFRHQQAQLQEPEDLHLEHHHRHHHHQEGMEESERDLEPMYHPHHLKDESAVSVPHCRGFIHLQDIIPFR